MTRQINQLRLEIKQAVLAPFFRVYLTQTPAVMWLETSLFKLKGRVQTRRPERPAHTLSTSTEVTNTRHAQLKARSTQSDLIAEGQTATPLSSGVNQTQMFSAARSCLSSSPRSSTWTPTAERRIAQSPTPDPSWLTRMSDPFSITASGLPCDV